MPKIEYVLEWPIEMTQHHILVDGKALCSGKVFGWMGSPEPRYRGAKPCWMEFCPECEREYAILFLEGGLQ